MPTDTADSNQLRILQRLSKLAREARAAADPDLEARFSNDHVLDCLLELCDGADDVVRHFRIPPEQPGPGT